MHDMPAVEEITAVEVRAALRNGAVDALLLLDCREPEELQLARIDGATHIPMGDIPLRMNELDPDREIVVFCHRGRRSYTVASFLKLQGFENVRSMRGGIDAWSVDVDPDVPRY